MLSDPIGNMLTIIRNASMINKKEVVIPYSKQKENLAKLLVKEGYLKQVKSEKLKVKSARQKTFVCELKYEGKKPAIDGIKRISKPGLRIYQSYKKLQRVFSGLGISIVSTPKGLMTNKEARKRKLGGEVICKVW